MKQDYVEVSFLGAPYFVVRYGVNKCFGDSIPTSKYFKKLKELVRKGNITEFNETDEEIIYKQDNEYYYITKENLPDRIIEELGIIKRQFNKRKYKTEKHSTWRLVIDRFLEKEDEIHRVKLMDYLKANRLLIAITPMTFLGLGLVFINGFGQMKIIDFMLMSLIAQASAVFIKRHFPAFLSAVKEIGRIFINGQYYKSSIDSDEIQKQKTIKSVKNPNSDIKKKIVKQINLIQNIIKNLCIESQKLYQKELYAMLGDYKVKLEEARQNKDEQPLVYEYDIDLQFFQRLLNLEAKINMNSVVDKNQYAEYDQTIAQIEESLREQLTGEDKPVVRSLEDESQAKLGI